MKPPSVNTAGTILPVREPGEPARKRPKHQTVDTTVIAAGVVKDTLTGLGLYETIPSTPLEIADGWIRFSIPTIWNQPSSDGFIYSGYCSNSEGIHFAFKMTDNLWQAADDVMKIYLATKADSKRTTDFDKHARSIIWILQYISSCVRIVQGRVALSGKERKLSGNERVWNNRARMVNRIVNRVGLRGLGLLYAYALNDCKFTTLMYMHESIRDEVADIVAQHLLERDFNMRDDIDLLCTASLIWSILQEEMSYEDVCKHLHLPNFVDKPIEWPFARLEHIKAKLNVPPERDLDEDLGKDMERLNSVPRISPLRAINGYEVFSTSADLQMKALDAGMCQCSNSSSEFHSVIADSYSYTWSRLHLAVYYQAWKDSVSPVTA
ncbi:hypothetical protein EDB80DRAFT_884721 [Ilyonectria destructans]|nr:hypothetical protein EDB80DRAFT_884721 [Ilyonectria destructans]